MCSILVHNLGRILWRKKWLETKASHITNVCLVVCFHGFLVIGISQGPESLSEEIPRTEDEANMKYMNQPLAGYILCNRVFSFLETVSFMCKLNSHRLRMGC